MPSITPMMSTMRREASLMPCMVLTTCCTTSPLRAASAGGIRGQLVGLLRVLGILAHGGGQFLHRRRRFFQ
jgi:hypothetical protein